MHGAEDAFRRWEPAVPLLMYLKDATRKIVDSHHR
jgi:hypothetical protein